MDKGTLKELSEATEAAKHDPNGGNAAYGVGLKAYEAIAALEDRIATAQLESETSAARIAVLEERMAKLEELLPSLEAVEPVAKTAKKTTAKG